MLVVSKKSYQESRCVGIILLSSSFKWRNGSDGKGLAWYTLAKQVVTGSIPGVPRIFGIVWIFIPACLLVQAYMRVK